MVLQQINEAPSSWNCPNQNPSHTLTSQLSNSVQPVCPGPPRIAPPKAFLRFLCDWEGQGHGSWLAVAQGLVCADMTQHLLRLHQPPPASSSVYSSCLCVSMLNPSFHSCFFFFTPCCLEEAVTPITQQMSVLYHSKCDIRNLNRLFSLEETYKDCSDLLLQKLIFSSCNVSPKTSGADDLFDCVMQLHMVWKTLIITPSYCSCLTVTGLQRLLWGSRKRVGTSLTNVSVTDRKSVV